jgi:cysteine synthase
MKRFMTEIWAYKKPDTTEKLIMVQIGKDVFWIKTLNDNNIGSYKKATLEEFCQMKSDEGYELDQKMLFAFVGSAGTVAGIPRKDPCEE